MICRVWTAVQRRAHSKEFIFNSLITGRQGLENAHDVYCSECGTLTNARSNDDKEGGQPNIYMAGVSTDELDTLEVLTLPLL